MTRRSGPCTGFSSFPCFIRSQCVFFLYPLTTPTAACEVDPLLCYRAQRGRLCCFLAHLPLLRHHPCTNDDDDDAVSATVLLLLLSDPAPAIAGFLRCRSCWRSTRGQRVYPYPSDPWVAGMHKTRVRTGTEGNSRGTGTGMGTLGTLKSIRGCYPY
jgi:hypothetical protein